MKLIVSGGGTGGHVYPAFTVLDTLLKPISTNSRLPTLSRGDLMWIGSQGGLEEELVKRYDLDFVGLSAGGLRGVGLLTSIRNAIRIIGSIGQARKILTQFKPDAILVTGGYACVAVVLAAWTKNLPVLIYLPDIVPGLAIRFLSRFADRIAVTSEESYRYFRREKVIVSGYPVRSEAFSLSRDQARRELELEPDERTLLVFGGSRGARSINKALMAGLSSLLPICQIIHISGRLDADWVAGMAKRLPDELLSRYHHHDYLHNMPQALAAADLAVARAGAATLGEFPAVGLPSVLVPYPYSGQHQDPNAKYMAENGAAVTIADAELDEKLLPTILELLYDAEALSAMKESAKAMARPDAAEVIAEQLWQIARLRAIRASTAVTEGRREEKEGV